MYKVCLSVYDHISAEVMNFFLDRDFYYKTYAEVVADGLRKSIKHDGMEKCIDVFVVEGR